MCIYIYIYLYTHVYTYIYIYIYIYGYIQQWCLATVAKVTYGHIQGDLPSYLLTIQTCSVTMPHSYVTHVDNIAPLVPSNCTTNMSKKRPMDCKNDLQKRPTDYPILFTAPWLIRMWPTGTTSHRCPVTVRQTCQKKNNRFQKRLGKETYWRSKQVERIMTYSNVRWLILMGHDASICDVTNSCGTWPIHMWHDSYSVCLLQPACLLQPRKQLRLVVLQHCACQNMTCNIDLPKMQTQATYLLHSGKRILLMVLQRRTWDLRNRRTKNADIVDIPVAVRQTAVDYSDAALCMRLAK